MGMGEKSSSFTLGDPSPTVFFLQVSRALLVRGHPKALSFVDRLFELFGDPNVGWDAARAIGQVGTVDNVLTKHNHAIIKVMLYEICVGC